MRIKFTPLKNFIKNKSTLFLLVLICVAFQKVDNVNEGIIIKSPIVIDRSYVKRIKINDTLPQTANYETLYIGKYVDTIRLVENVIRPSHRRIRIKNSGICSTALVIKVDTMQLISGKNIEYYNNGKDKKEIFYEAYPVFLCNTQEDTLYIGSGIVLPIKMEALDIENKWRFIEQSRMYFCGTGLPKFFIEGNGIIVTSAPKYTGSYKTKLRLRYNNMTSNEFYGSINMEQFNIELDSARYNRYLIEH